MFAPDMGDNYKANIGWVKKCPSAYYKPVWRISSLIRGTKNIIGPI